MGELILCSEPIAAMPYYLEGVSLNIYSLEELSYYILHNTYLIERDFMSEELCTWIAREAKQIKLAERLRDIMHGNRSLSDFVFEIIKTCGYCTMAEMQEVILEIRQLEEKSDFECNKIRADKLMENEKYLSSIYEYKRLLDSEEAKTENAMLVGNIWHNLGTAYARLFLFEEAAKCYQKAYSLNEKQESLREWLMTYRCMKDEEGFMKAARENLLDDTYITEVKNELSLASRNQNTVEFEEKLEAIAMLGDRDMAQHTREINKIILEWKEDYRRINRV
ncbi:MAG: tetratricopeptide repeat protein [Agathobacter sp.]|nr:tetratricopeptide repeat protein [Agathobacter sp.]